MGNKRLYIGFTKRRWDKIALAFLGVLLIAQIAQVVYAIGYKVVLDDMTGEVVSSGFVWNSDDFIMAIILYVPAFLVAYAELVYPGVLIYSYYLDLIHGQCSSVKGSGIPLSDAELFTLSW